MPVPSGNPEEAKSANSSSCSSESSSENMKAQIDEKIKLLKTCLQNKPNDPTPEMKRLLSVVSEKEEGDIEFTQFTGLTLFKKKESTYFGKHSQQMSEGKTEIEEKFWNEFKIADPNVKKEISFKKSDNHLVYST